MKDARAALDLRLGRETFAAFAGDFEERFVDVVVVCHTSSRVGGCEFLVNNLGLLLRRILRRKRRATNSSYPNTGFEIIVPGRGLLLEQYSALRKRPSP